MTAGEIASLVKIEDTNDYQLVVISSDRHSATLLLPSHHQKLGRFRNIACVQSFAELFEIYLTHKNRKLVVFVDVTLNEPLHELRGMIYGAHAERRGLLFAFSHKKISENHFEHLVSSGFDDVFELQSGDNRKYLRIYSWIRRFGSTPISEENAKRDAIAHLSRKKNNRIGKWTIIKSEKSASNDGGERVQLTQQEVDFLAFLFEPELTRDSSYEKFFKAPHAIVHKLKGKLGNDLPIRHDRGGRYYLTREGVSGPKAKNS
jgi:hypothetical protein